MNASAVKNRVLIVDDVPENIRVIENILRQAGDYAVAAALNGQKALQMARKILPDVILLDIVMDGMDGFEVCEILKASPVTRDIPVIFQTAQRSETEDIVRGFQSGGADYITKPVNEAELLARVRTHIALKKAHDAVRESERRYRAVVEDMTELVCRFRPDGELVFVNEAFRRHFGKSGGELLGTSFLDLIPEGDRETVRRSLMPLCREVPATTCEHRVEGPDGGVRWQHCTSRAVFNNDGAVREIQFVGRDITDRVHAEEAYRNLVDHSHLGMVIFQTDRCVFANRRMAEIIARRVAELTGMTWSKFQEMAHIEDRKTLLTHFNAAVSSPAGTAHCAARFFRRSGDVCWLDIRFAQVSHQGTPAVQISLMDITRGKGAEAPPGGRETFHDMIGASAPMQRVYSLVEQFAPTDIAVLLNGETGVGKELAAEALHAQSLRACGPLVRVNCAALPENLIESELFGHVRGAFTGADGDREGRFQAADGGTLFLDEIGELPHHVQVKLLRAIETRTVQRLGDSKLQEVDIRIISATNADLQQRVEDGRFREDLLFRLKGAHIHLPPLRDRGDDLLALFHHFADHFREWRGRCPVRVREDATALLARYPWPGNVRELKNAAERACAVCPGDILTPEDLPPEVRGWTADAFDARTGPGSTAAPEPAFPGMSAEEAMIRKALASSRWHKSRAARLLGIARSTLYLKMAEYGIDKEG